MKRKKNFLFLSCMLLLLAAGVFGRRLPASAAGASRQAAEKTPDKEAGNTQAEGRAQAAGQAGGRAQAVVQAEGSEQAAVQAGGSEQAAVHAEGRAQAAGQAEEAAALLQRQYGQYRQRFEKIQTVSGITANGYRVITSQVFTVALESFGEVTFVPALDKSSRRLALFFADEDGGIVYKTDRLETNYTGRGRLRQPNRGIAGVSFQDLDGDGLTDIVLITSCVNDAGSYAGKAYKVGDVLFQEKNGFYRDWRLSDKINRFSMNRSVEEITAFVKDGYSTEFLYTAATQEELLDQGFRIIPEQCYWRRFEKLGRLRVVPGTYTIADYDIFMIYLVNEQGYIVWSLQPMGDFDNLYALKGMTCRDIDGDGMKDIVVLARYSYEGKAGELLVESDYDIYYQRTGGFSEDTQIREAVPCEEEETLEGLVEKARAYWGWKPEV